MLKDFSLKFIDIMIGLVLGLGFQWWPELNQPWQYIAFIFVYFDIVDYWIEYSPSLKKWPPKREIDVMLDIAIMFSLFLYIYSTQLSIVYFLASSILIRVFDYFWLLSSKMEFRPIGSDKIYMDTWLKLNLVIASTTLTILIFTQYYILVHPIFVLYIYIISRMLVRVFASLNYKRVHYV